MLYVPTGDLVKFKNRRIARFFALRIGARDFLIVAATCFQRRLPTTLRHQLQRLAAQQTRYRRHPCAERKSASTPSFEVRGGPSPNLRRGILRLPALVPFVISISGCGSICRSRVSHLSTPHPKPRAARRPFIRRPLTAALLQRARISRNASP